MQHAYDLISRQSLWYEEKGIFLLFGESRYSLFSMRFHLMKS